MGTMENLNIAFVGESQANRRYLAFAKKAEEERMKNIAMLFRAVADAETVHAHNHLKTYGGVKTTKENVQKAIEGEKYENQEMYPKFINDAKNEGNAEAEKVFVWANQVEKIHQGLYEKALENIESGQDIEKRDYYVCQLCGNTIEGEPPEKCQICGVPKEQFRKVG
jgi:rubrerythrin